MNKALVLAVCLACCRAPAQTGKWAVHEWGTFTSLQDESGRTLGGINSDDEPAPKFVHDLDSLLILKPDTLPPILYQGAPHCHPDVTMRLETPVIYFHPPPGTTLPQTVDVKVSWHGGWLTQFYPDAETGLPDPQTVTLEKFFGKLGGDTTTRLVWNGLKIGGDAPGPVTTDHVWTAPRAVNAASVTTAGNECEKFLFYRGVGHLPAPLRVTRQNDQFHLFSQLDPAFTGGLKIKQLWLAQFRPDGQCAFRVLKSLTAGGDLQQTLRSTPAVFPDRDFSAANLAALRGLMRTALVEDGLFADEADALLNTWELSYFKSAGLRLFFLVPREWTDHYLPLELSVPADVSRVMVGRLELVSPEQRELLRQLAAAPVPKAPWAAITVKNGQVVTNVPVPPAYRNLGRFRNTLVLDELDRHPTESLSAFVQMNGLQAYKQ